MPTKIKAAVILAIFLWSSAFVAIRAGLEGYSPEGLALLRFIIASICMGIIYFLLPKRKKANLKDVALMLTCGVIGVGIYNLCLNHGEVSISSGMSSFIISQSPLLTAFFAVIFLGEELTPLRCVGFITSVCGVALIAFGEQGGFGWDPSLTYILIATFASGFYSIVQKPFVKKYHAIEVTAFFVWGGTLFLCVYYANLIHDLQHPTLLPTLMAVYLGIFPAAIALIAWSYVLREIPAARAGSFIYFMPFLATFLGWLLLGEVPVLLAIAGGVLAIVGVWIVNHSYKKPPVSLPNATENR